LLLCQFSQFRRRHFSRQPTMEPPERFRRFVLAKKNIFGLLLPPVQAE
jgi:hypothetical protein